MKRLKWVLIGLGVGLAVIAVAIVSLWLTDHVELAIALIVGLSVLISFVVASLWAAFLLKMGGELAVRAQESDDARDIAQARIAIELVKTMRQERTQLALPPMPQPQAAQWLPQLNEWEGTGDD